MPVDNNHDRPAFALTIEELLSRYFSGLAPAAHTSRAIVSLCIALAPEGTFHCGDEDAFMAHLGVLLSAYRDKSIDQDTVMSTALAMAENAYNGDRLSMRIGAA